MEISTEIKPGTGTENIAMVYMKLVCTGNTSDNGHLSGNHNVNTVVTKARWAPNNRSMSASRM